MLGRAMNYGSHRTRHSFSRIKEVLKLPNSAGVQTQSCKWFLNGDIRGTFDDITPISGFSGKLSLEFIDYKLLKPEYTLEEARDHDANYSVPLHIILKLTNHETGEVKTQDIFSEGFPLMTDSGTFVINGTERVIVSQPVRSPGVYYHSNFDKNGRQAFGATVISNRGTWLGYETDTKDLAYVRIDRTRKLPLTALVHALGFGSDSEVTDTFGESNSLCFTLGKDIHKNPADSCVVEALKDIYGRLRPGEPKTIDSFCLLLYAKFFGSRRYDLTPVGRYKTDKKLPLKNRLLKQTLAETLANPDTDEIIAKKGDVVTHGILDKLSPYLDRDDSKMVTYEPSKGDVLPGPVTVQEIKVYSKVDPEHIIKLVSSGRIADDVKHLTPADVLASISYFFNLQDSIGTTDDIDHLGNRRIRRVGKLLQNQFGIGLAKMERVVRKRMSVQDISTVTPQQLINIRPVVASVKKFFDSSQSSQFIDQNNPLGELTHKRRVSALGSGGLSRDRAGHEVHDVHYTHYGRLCPIKTPEGPNTGLINFLATYTVVNRYGSIGTPHRRVSWGTHKVTDKIDYLITNVEDSCIIAGANAPLNEGGPFKDKVVLARRKEDNLEVTPDKISYMDIIPKQVVPVTSACIPFLENDDSNRALMGTNHQHQAVPLINPHAPVVGTGMEYRTAHDSEDTLVAKTPGIVEYVNANEIRIRRDDDTLGKYALEKFRQSNAIKNYNQTPAVKRDERVVADGVIADGLAMEDDELALGQNPTTAFLTWNIYNYEDAVMISERMVKDDAYTSIRIEDYESEARDTKLGLEEITHEIPSVGEDVFKDFDEEGIVRISAKVRNSNILVGKAAPKGVTELPAKERLLHAIFDEKAREIRDTSLRVPHGSGGIIQNVQVFTREAGDELLPGINKMVRVYIVQKRKIQVGNKMSGRHENKGTITLACPEEDMPYLPDGCPVDIRLNPMGVPSRMNIGQVLELHLGITARQLGAHVTTPVFDGTSEDDMWNMVHEAGIGKGSKTVLYDGRAGEPLYNRVSVGIMYYSKLTHMVDDKVHARSTGPYSLATQQPFSDKAQFGGQRFGEMGVWALGTYGAVYTLQETLAYKSDDVVGRVKAYEAIVRGERIPKPGVPELFRVLVKGLQSLGLDIKVLDMDHKETELRDMDDGSNDHFDIDTLPKLVEQQEKKKLAEETAKKDDKSAESVNQSGSSTSSDDKVSE